MPPVREEIMARRASVEFLAEVKQRLADAFGDRFRGVILYGSEARGDAREDSDVDLMVLLEGPIDVWQDIQTGVQAVYDLELYSDPFLPLSVLPVDHARYLAQERLLYRNAKNDGVPL